MRRSELLRVLVLVTALLPGWLPAAHADIEVTDPAGRRILLKDDGTWRVLEVKEPGAAASAAEANKADKAPEFADLRLLRMTGNGHADEDADDQTGERASRHASLRWRIRAGRIMDGRGTGACGS